MKCLDSDILIAILRGNKDASPIVELIDETGGAVTTSINAYEILFGARRSANKKENTSEAIKLLAKLDILEMNLECADKASEIHAKLAEEGKQIDLRDIFIGAIAQCKGCTLVTRNEKDFSKIRELEIEKW